MGSCNCKESVNNQLLQKIPCSPPIPCPPCVGELEDELLIIINALQAEINSLNNGTSDGILAGWLYNS